MTIGKFVHDIQTIFPPKEEIPPKPRQPIGELDKRVLPEITPIERPRIPSWVNEDKFIMVPKEARITIEENLPKKLGDVPPSGIDVLAYYLPFHFYSKKWGIYVLASGILSVASMFVSASGDKLFKNEDLLAFEILMQHERFHFFCEIACARAELLSGCEIYLHYYHDRKVAAIEEALSNAYIFRTTLRRQPKFVIEKVRQWMKAQGPGYRDFEKCLTHSMFTQWCRIATQRMEEPAISIKNYIKVSPSKFILGANQYKRIGGKLISASGNSISLPTEFLFAGLTRSTVAPTQLIADVTGIGVLKPFVKYKGLRVLVHVNDHPPPHIHLEIPPGRDFPRLEWPTLNPLPGDPKLTRMQERLLDKYLFKYGDMIDKKVRMVYQVTA